MKLPKGPQQEVVGLDADVQVHEAAHSLDPAIGQSTSDGFFQIVFRICKYLIMATPHSPSVSPTLLSKWKVIQSHKVRDAYGMAEFGSKAAGVTVMPGDQCAGVSHGPLGEVAAGEKQLGERSRALDREPGGLFPGWPETGASLSDLGS